MNYLISYWLPPSASEERKNALKTYFDMQCISKSYFGAEQIIVTNVDYPGAIDFTNSDEFDYKLGLFSRYYALGHLLREGMQFPITLHDHDMFIRSAIPENRSAIRCTSGNENYFSDQFVIFPECSRKALEAYIEKLENQDFYKGLHHGYGSETRHEGMYSPEVAHANMIPPPFKDVSINVDIPYRDLVSFDIKDQHSLDPGYSECSPIHEDALAVHGHLNKGPATDALIDWLIRD